MKYKKLKVMPNKHVLITTVEERDWLLTQLNRVGWTWHSGDKPKDFLIFTLPAYINLQNTFGFWQVDYEGDCPPKATLLSIKELKTLLQQ